MQKYTLKKDKFNTGNDTIYRLEPYFNDTVPTAIINHENKTVRPCHGYYSKHPYAKLNKAIAVRMGYTWSE